VILLNDMIEIYRRFLEDASQVSRSLPAEIEQYATTVSSLPKEKIKLRLIMVKGLIKAHENALRVKHQYKGYVFIQAGHRMLNICWSELDLLGGKKEKPSSGESVFFAVEVLLEKIEELISEVDYGKLLTAINWLSRYENINADS
jgi:hypothetical protein